jgi:hypothetical protein
LDITVDQQVGAGEFASHVAQQDGRAADVAGPFRSLPRVEVIHRYLVHRLHTGRDDSQHSVVAAARGDVGGDVEGDGKRPAVVVVGVLADEVDPAGRADDQFGWATECLVELVAKLLVGHQSSGRSRSRCAALSGVMSRCGWASSS